MAKASKTAPDTADRILAAADQEFCESGFDGTSVRDIAERAGVNKASVFYHYGGKEALFERVLQGYYQTHQSALASNLAGVSDLAGGVHRVIDTYLDFMAENRRYARLIQHQVAGSEAHHPLIERNLRALFESTRAILESLAPSDGPLASRHFFVTVSGMVINYFTYAPVLHALWDDDPLSQASIEERRAHIHWMVDRIVEGLEAGL